MKRFLLVAVGILAAWGTAQGITVSYDTNAVSLANALTLGGGSGLIVTGVALQGHSNGFQSSTGTYVNPSLTYNISPGIVLSSGDVLDYSDGPNLFVNNSTAWGVLETGPQKALLDPITGVRQHWDVTQLDITFNMAPGHDTVFFNVVFGSEEYPEYVGSQFVDGFGLYVNGGNIAFVDGLPVNINHPAFAAIPGTELDGVLNHRIPQTFSKFVGDGSVGNTLTIIICDTTDDIYDSTAYVSQLGGTEPPPIIPEPLTMAGLCLGLGCLTRYLRRRVG